MPLHRTWLVILVVILLSGCQTWPDRLPPTEALPQESTQGVVEIRYFDSVSGGDVSALTDLERFPERPDETAELTVLDIPRNRGNNYGSLIRGYIQPPTDGRYRFYISADDTAELLFSSSGDVSDTRVIAAVPRFTDYQKYDTYSGQTSSEHDLIAGKKYYFEVRHKEGYGGDHLSVAWDGPGISRSVIEGQYLYSYAGGDAQADGTESVEEAFGQGYRAGYFDGSESIPFRPVYPMLDNDGDGIYDNWEVFYGLDPTDPGDASGDTDDDLLSALDEFWLGSHPTNPDTDGDGIPDGVEFAYGLDPLEPADAVQDMDGDGYSNLEEYQAGTVLDDPESFPEIQVEMIPGLMGQYFEARSFETFVSSRIEDELVFDWGGGTPVEGISSNNFSARWVGYIVPPGDDGVRDYEFRVIRDDGVRIRVDNQLVVDAWRGPASTEFTGKVTLAVGQKVPITIEFYEGYGSASMSLRILDVAKGEVIPHQQLFQIPSPESEGSEDLDGDGMPDIWEMVYGLDPWKSNASGIVNDQQVSNLEAYESGRHPWTLEEAEQWRVVGFAAPAQPDEPPVEESVETSSFTLTWTAPSERVDGSPFTFSEIDYYLIEYGESPDNLDRSVQVEIGETRYEFKGLASGTWYLAVKVVDSNGLESELSDVVEHIVE